MTGILGLDLGSNYMGGQSGDIIHAAGTYLGYGNSAIILDRISVEKPCRPCNNHFTFDIEGKRNSLCGLLFGQYPESGIVPAANYVNLGAPPPLVVPPDIKT